jgi:DNA-binding NarL/FixJ family response regulator
MQILVADDHEMLCVAFSDHLKKAASGISPTPVNVTPTFSLADAITAVNADPRPDFVFLDLSLDGDNLGSTTFRRFQESNPHNVPVIIYTGLALRESGTIETLRACLFSKDEAFKARGVILKETKLDAAFIGLARLLNGEPWMPYDVLTELATTMEVRPSRNGYHLGLSPREWEVACALTRGLEDKEIAKELGLSPAYLRQVTGQIYRKLAVKNRTQVVGLMHASGYSATFPSTSA